MGKEVAHNANKRQRVTGPQEIKPKEGPKTFTEAALKMKGHSWSPGSIKEVKKPSPGREKTAIQQKEGGRKSP